MKLNIIHTLWFVALFPFLLPALPVSAQHSDSVYMFRFVPGKDMFYIPWRGNGREMERLLSVIDKNREPIENGWMYLCVTSYGSTPDSKHTASKVAAVRRNRVKSELILRGNLHEDNFVTDRVWAEPYIGTDGKPARNIVTVTLPASVVKVAEIAGAEAAARVEAYRRRISGVEKCERPAPDEEQTPVQADVDSGETETSVSGSVAEGRDRTAPEESRASGLDDVTEKTSGCSRGHVSLRANLLRWATLTPDLGLEWRVSPRVGILVDGSYTSWSWKGGDRRYALWEVNPEVRYYMWHQKRGYIGAMYKAGAFNFKLGGTGRQGDLMGGGVTGGYRLCVSDAVSFDFSLGLGYVRAEYDRYALIDGVRVRNGNEVKNWWGPTRAGVTLVWTIF